ncbi:MAG: ATP-binding protein [Rubripirellula sp.]
MTKAVETSNSDLDQDTRIRVAEILFASGAAVGFLDFGFSSVGMHPARGYISLSAAVCLISLIFVLRRTRALDMSLALAALVASATFLVPFALSGYGVLLTLGISVPIAATMTMNPRCGLVASAYYGLFSMVLAISVGLGWWTPPFQPHQFARGTISEVTTAVLIMAAICGTSLFREKVIRSTEAKRRLSDESLQKQLAGLRLLAETTSEMWTVDVNGDRWTELLTQIAEHLDCDAFTNYEIRRDRLWLAAYAGLPDSAVGDFQSIDFGEKLCGLCARTEKPVYLSESELQDHSHGELITKLGLRTVAVVPLIFGGNLVGTLGFGSTRKAAFAEEEIDFIRTLGQTVASIRGRVLADAKNRVSELRFRTIVDSASHSFFVVDRQGRFVDVNSRACFALGYDREDLLKMRLTDITPRMSVERIVEIHGELLNEDVVCEDGFHQRKDGTAFPVDVHFSRVSSEDSDHMVVLAHDASNRQQIAERLVQSQKLEAIGRLAGGLAHDFNNLICVINSYSELLMTDVSLPENYRTWGHAIHDAGQRGASLTKQLLVFGRKAVFDVEAIDLNEVVADAQRLLARLIAENINFVAELSPTPCGVLADRSQIDQVLINLVVNARDSMPHGGNLVLRTERVRGNQAGDVHADGDSELIRLSVTDTGHGIAAESIPMVFDPFYTTKNVGAGTGLGLAVVYGIVRESGGSIDVVSEYGSGSEFTITLPAHPLGERDVKNRPVLSRVDGLTVLLVEDEPAVRKVATLALGQAGYVVLEAQSSRHAIELAKEHASEICVLLTDVVMPDLNGPEIVREIRSFLPELPVLYMSGYSAETLTEMTEIGEGAGVLSKPFSLNELSKRVREATTPSGSTTVRSEVP